MVGYPNVGKSSVINTLCKKKLVAVGSMPGKTKNLQTHFLEENLLLCDCPGLVFPNAASTKAEMACNGVLPIDKIKDCTSPVYLLCERIPKIVFEKLYNIKILLHDNEYNLLADSFLNSYALSRGFVTGNGLPD
jgi:large subunit GTPase 1